MQSRQGPARPKKIEPRNIKVKKSEADKADAATGSAKYNLTLTDAQKVQVSIIDWKRWAIRALLLQSYVILCHGVASVCITAYVHPLIGESYWLAISLYGFFVNIMLYFFGSGEAIMAISYVWSWGQFTMGVLLIFAGIALNIGLFFCGTMTNTDYKDGLPKELIRNCENTTLRSSSPTSKAEIIQVERLKMLCELYDSKLAQNTVHILPLILPPITVICTLFACFTTFYALKVVPKRFQKGTIDAKYVEPYETYGFYVGRATPKVAGDDDVLEEQSNIVTLSGEQEEASLIRSRENRRPSEEVKASALSVTGSETAAEDNADAQDKTRVGKPLSPLPPTSNTYIGTDKSKKLK